MNLVKSKDRRVATIHRLDLKKYEHQVISILLTHRLKLCFKLTNTVMALRASLVLRTIPS